MERSRKRHQKRSQANGPERSLLSGQERRLQEALSFNLLSDRFMTLCLKDAPASEYVLRIL